MPTNFLANLGSGLRNFRGFLSPEFATGANIGAGLRDRFKKRPGEPEGAETENFPSLPVSSPTSPTPSNPASATDALENSVADGEAAARSKLPINRLDIGVPALSPAPSMAEIRSPLPSLPARRDLPLAVPPAPAGTGPAGLAPEMDMDRRNVPIPRLPGHAGGPVPYSPVEATRYDSVMKHARRDAGGKLLGKAEGGGFNRNWKMALRNAMLGAGAAMARGGGIESALGGALAGGVGSYFNPQAGYEFAFDYGERPKLEAERAREQATKDRANLEILNRAKLEDLQAGTGLKGAQGDKARADIDLGLKAEERQRLVAKSQVALNQARAEAARTGVPQKVDRVNPETGAFETVMFYPNGRMEVVGGSAQAAMNLQDIRSREKITDKQQSGATGRTAMTTASAKERAQMEIDAQRELAAGGDGSGMKKPSDSQGGKTATMSQLREFYKSKGITDDAEIRRRAKEFKVTVKD